MIRQLAGLVRNVVILGVIVYLLFFVKLGEYTAFQHLMRISRTEEAQELKREAAEASKRVGGKIKKQIEQELPERLPVRRERVAPQSGDDETTATER